ncbi:MAG TPA: maleylpyruvate isomerase family mycothiol-dependent enzyme [Dermatophilaceae bacterium]|nr:maleylpyruvate isomerase family mycothiol-dependent enzyme [Dermatophilaceae bacterium]
MQSPFLTLDEYGDGLGRAATVLRANAAAAGLDAPVPTCPGWTVRDLVAHQGMVHRWASGHLRGAPVEDTDAVRREGLGQADLLGWFDRGATALLQAIVDAPDDLEAPVFLREAPAPRLFWTRRQCHETTIHAVDAIGARLGRPARAAETWLREPLAFDGIDELLRGFLTRRRQGVHSPEETRLLVRPEGAEVGWLVVVTPDEPVSTTRLDLTGSGVPDADHELSGGAVELYLQLWNRGPVPADESARAGEGSAWAWWRRHVTVNWA